MDMCIYMRAMLWTAQELVLSGFDTGFGKGFGEADEVGKLLGSLR